MKILLIVLGVAALVFVSMVWIRTWYIIKLWEQKNDPDL